jgi:hypothetical protein
MPHKDDFPVILFSSLLYTRQQFFLSRLVAEKNASGKQPVKSESRQ